MLVWRKRKAGRTAREPFGNVGQDWDCISRETLWLQWEQMEISGASIYLDLSFHVRGQTGSDFSFPLEANAKSERAIADCGCMREKNRIRGLWEKIGEESAGKEWNGRQKKCKRCKVEPDWLPPGLSSFATRHCLKHRTCIVFVYSLNFAIALASDIYIRATQINSANSAFCTLWT